MAYEEAPNLTLPAVLPLALVGLGWGYFGAPLVRMIWDVILVFVNAVVEVWELSLDLFQAADTVREKV